VSMAMFNRNSGVSDSPLDSPKDPAIYVSESKQKWEAVVTSAIELGAQDLVVADVGCGVFLNDPAVMGGCLGAALNKYQGRLESVVVCTPGSNKTFFCACERAFQGKDPREVCPEGAKCSQLADAAHAARFSHPGSEPTPGPGESFVDACIRTLAAHPVEVQKPLCHYGKHCYIKTPAHLARFSHPDREDDAGDAGSPGGVAQESSPALLPGVHRGDRTGGGYSSGGSSGGPTPKVGLCSPVQAKLDTSRPVCKYGPKCYQQNPEHLASFAHPWLEGETAEEAKKRKDIQSSHELLNYAKSGNWAGIYKAVKDQPDLVNVRPDVRRFALIHYACFQIGHEQVQFLIDCGADPKLLTNDGMTPVDVLSEAIRTDPGKTPDEVALDAALLKWLEKRAAGENIPFTRPAKIASDLSPTADTEKPSGLVMIVSRCLNRELDGEYAELTRMHNGYPVFRKSAAGVKMYLYYAITDSKMNSGWTIDKAIMESSLVGTASKSDGAVPAYLGPSMCGGDPSKQYQGEYWRVWYSSLLGGGYYSKDVLMKVTRKGALRF